MALRGKAVCANIMQMDLEVPPDGPAFLKRETAEAVCADAVEPGAQPVFDYELRSEDPDAPSLGLINRHREIARLHALGHTNNQICTALGYTAAWMSTVLHDPFIQAEIRKWRDRLVADDAITIMKRTSVNAALRLERSVLDPGDKNGYDASKFILEKVTGKARQEVTVESGTLGSFMDLLKQMREQREPLDVTPVAALPAGKEPDSAVRWNEWLDKELI